MEFRPCIDIHNGKVKQIIGGSLRDEGDFAQENFVAEQSAADFARLYARHGLKGGHIILLNPKTSEYYDQTKTQALEALWAYPGGLQIGGGITADTAEEFLQAGASHVIVTSYVFSEGKVHYDRLKLLKQRVGKEHLVLDLSCRKQGDDYYVVTDRWQKFTSEKVTPDFLRMLQEFADEFLVHAVDVEGNASGIELPIAAMLAEVDGIATTYAGGVGSMEDLIQLKEIGQGKVNVTIGSALDLFGGSLDFQNVLDFCKQ